MNPTRKTTTPAGFTVTEILIVLAIMALLVGMSLSAFSSAVAQSRVSRTKVIIAKLDQLVMERYESYRTRPVPIRSTAGVDPRINARNRLNALREIMRMELPCSQVDVQTLPTVAGLAQTSINRGYNRRLASVTWSPEWQEAECLYLIVASMRDHDKSALDFFGKDEIGDVDQDGVPEILDAWGNPIQFIRWAPGYCSDATPPAVSVQRQFMPDGTVFPDRFDPLKADSRWADNDNTNNPFDLKPLIFSVGPDKSITVSGIQLPSGNTQLNDPYRKIGGNFIGTILTPSAAADNITNHYQEAE